MKKILFILLSLFVISSVSAGPYDIDGITFNDTIFLDATDSVYKATTEHCVYVLTENITIGSATSGQLDAGTGGWDFSLLDTIALISEAGEYNTLTCTLDASGGSMVRWARNNVTYIRNIRMDVGWTPTDSFTNGQGPVTISILNCQDMLIDSSFFRTAGFNMSTGSKGTRAVVASKTAFGNPAYNQDIYNVVFRDDSIIYDGTGHNNRQYYPNSAMYSTFNGTQTTLDTGSREDFNVKLVSSYLASTWTGWQIETDTAAAGVIVCDSNTFDIGYVQNSTVPGAGGSYVGDAGAIAIYGIDKYFISYNTMPLKVDSTASPQILGNCGIFFASTLNEHLQENPRSEISYNTWHAGLNYTIDHAYCVFQKFSGIEELDVHNNDFTLTVFGNAWDMAGVMWTWSHFDVDYYQNKYTVVSQSDASEAFGIIIRNHDSASGHSSTYTDDTIYSNDNFFRFYNDGANINNITFTRMHLARVDTSSILSGQVYDSYNNIGDIFEVDFVDMTTDANVVDTTTPDWLGTSNTDYLDWFRNLQITTKDEYGTNVNASVVITNTYGDTVYNTTVGTDGADTLLTKYWHNTAGTADSSYNQFIGTATYNEETLVDTFSVGETDYTAIFTFSGGTLIPRKVITRSTILQNIR